MRATRTQRPRAPRHRTPRRLRPSLVCAVLAAFVWSTPSEASSPIDDASRDLHTAHALSLFRTTGETPELSPEEHQRWLQHTLSNLDDASLADTWSRLLPFTSDPMVAELLPTLESRLRHDALPLELLLRDAIACHRPDTEATVERWLALVLADTARAMPGARVQLAELLLLRARQHTTSDRRDLELEALALLDDALSTTSHPDWLASRDALLQALGATEDEREEAHTRLFARQPNAIGCWSTPSTPRTSTAFDDLPELRPEHPVALARYAPFEPPSSAPTPKRSTSSPYAAFDDEEPTPYAIATPAKPRSASRYRAWDDDDWTDSSPKTATVHTQPRSNSRYRAFGDDDVPTTDGDYQPLGGWDDPASRAQQPTVASAAASARLEYHPFEEEPALNAVWLPRERVALPTATWVLSGTGAPEAMTLSLTASGARWSVERSGWWHARAMTVVGAPGLVMRSPDGAALIFATELTPGSGASASAVLERVSGALCETPDGALVETPESVVVLVSCGVDAPLRALLPSAPGTP